MKTKADLFREYARVSEMCEGTKVQPYLCVKDSYDVMSRQPNFDAPPETYSFAIAIIEDRPVFIGDELFDMCGHKYRVEKDSFINPNCYSFNPPKPKTMTIEMRYTQNGILQYRHSFHNGAIHLPGKWFDVPYESINNDWLGENSVEDAEKAFHRIKLHFI